MSGRVCYIMRADRGSRIDSLRLVGARTDELWTVPVAAASSAEEGELFDEQTISAAAEWVRGRTLGESNRAGSLGLLCLDAEGFAAGWVTSPSAESRVVSLVAHSGVASEEAGSLVGPGLGFFLPSDREAGVQALAVATEPEVKVKGAKEEIAVPGATAALRVPVIAGADAPVRLLLDVLDARGVAVGGVTTIWHAMARVWGNPASHSASNGAAKSEIVADDSGVSAVVLVDPRGKLLWCWAAKGELMAGGSLRLAQSGSVGRAPAPTLNDAARLINDWMAWGAQLGVVPRRVACIAADDPVGIGEDSASYKAGQFGAKLAGAWGGAGVDLVLDNDPIGATLSRLAATVADLEPDEKNIAGIETLTNRPGKVHRRMYTWVAIGISAGALLSLGIAYKLRSSAAQIAEAATEQDVRWRSVVQASYPNIMKLPGVDPEFELDKMLKRNEQENERSKREPTRPIVEELETLSMALADPEVELESMTFSPGANASVTVVVLVPDIPQAEAVFKSLSSIRGSNIESWQTPGYVPAGAKIRGTFTGKWRNPKPANATASQPAPVRTPTPTPATSASTRNAPAAHPPTVRSDGTMPGAQPLRPIPAPTAAPVPAPQPIDAPKKSEDTPVSSDGEGSALPPRSQPAPANPNSGGGR